MTETTGATDSHGHRGPQLRRRFSKRPERYGFLTVLLLADIVVLFAMPVTRLGEVFTLAFMTTTMLMALRTTEVSRRAMRLAQSAAVVALVVGVAGALIGIGRWYQGVVFLLIVGLLVVTPVLIMLRILTSQTVTLQTVLGAICVYILIGLVFTCVFLGVNGVSMAVSNTPFLAQGASDQPSSYVYLSFITLATVGYGDLTPTGNLPRMLCVFEGIAGQIFLVTAVSRLVSLYGRREPDQSHDGPGEDSEAAGGE